MKTSEEWINKVGEAVAAEMFIPDIKSSPTTEIVKSIQQDAYLAGLKKASEIAEPLHKPVQLAPMLKPVECHCERCAELISVRQAILAEMERVKTTTQNATLDR